MTLPELRVQLRSRGCSPAGGKQTLVERLNDAIALEMHGREQGMQQAHRQQDAPPPMYYEPQVRPHISLPHRRPSSAAALVYRNVLEHDSRISFNCGDNHNSHPLVPTQSCARTGDTPTRIASLSNTNTHKPPRAL